MIIYFFKTREEKTIHIVLRASDLGARLIVTIYYWLSPYNQLIKWIADHHFHNHNWLSFQPALPKFTFSTFTPDPNLQNPDLHKTQNYTNSNLHSSDLHTPKFIQPHIGIHNSNLHQTEPKFTQTKFTQNRNWVETKLFHVRSFFNLPVLIMEFTLYSLSKIWRKSFV